jgi:hypothetical protein
MVRRVGKYASAHSLTGVLREVAPLAILQPRIKTADWCHYGEPHEVWRVGFRLDQSVVSHGHCSKAGVFGAYAHIEVVQPKSYSSGRESQEGFDAGAIFPLARALAFVPSLVGLGSGVREEGSIGCSLATAMYAMVNVNLSLLCIWDQFWL